jgi:hypothetical protein
VRLAETIVSGASVASITLSLIPSTYRDLILEIYGRGTASAASITVGLRFNGDTGANYDDQNNYGNASSSAASEHLAQTSILAFQIAGATAPANVAGGGAYLIPHYAGITFQKFITGPNTLKLSTSSGGLYSINAAGHWRSTAAITSITLTPSSGNLDIGTVVRVLGLPV